MMRMRLCMYVVANVTDVYECIWGTLRVYNAS